MRYNKRADRMLHYFGDLLKRTDELGNKPRFTKRQLQKWWQNHKGQDFADKINECIDLTAELMNKLDDLIDEWK